MCCAPRAGTPNRKGSAAPRLRCRGQPGAAKSACVAGAGPSGASAGQHETHQGGGSAAGENPGNITGVARGEIEIRRAGHGVVFCGPEGYALNTEGDIHTYHSFTVPFKSGSATMGSVT